MIATTTATQGECADLFKKVGKEASSVTPKDEMVIGDALRKLAQGNCLDGKVDKDYDFFEFEDKSLANDYSLQQLQEETKMMEDEDEEFRELVKQAMAANGI